MKISELRSGQGNVEIKAEITEKGEEREFNKFGRQIRVATAKVKDESGSIALSLWNDDIDRVKEGDKIKITNGFVKEFQGELQLTTGKFGKLEVLGEETQEEKEKVEEEPAESEAEDAEEDEEEQEEV